MPERKRIERIKSILIAVLTVSAMALLYLSFVPQGAALLKKTPGSASAGEATSYADGTLPVMLVITAEDGARLGAAYSAAAVSAAAETTAPLLAEALATAGRPVPVGAAQLCQALEGSSILFDYAADVPLSALAGWLTTNCTLPGSARFLVLAGEQDGAALYYAANRGILYRCATDVRTAELAARTVVAAGKDDGTQPAYTMKQPGALTQWAMLPRETPELPTVRAANPFQSGLNPENLLSAFGMNRFVANCYPEADGSLVYVDGSCSLRIAQQGQVQFLQTDASVLPVSDMSPAGAIAAARRLLSAGPELSAGEAKLRFSGITQHTTGRAYTVRFDYIINGVLICRPDGPAAEVLISDGAITSARIWFCSYEQTAHTERPLPPEQAAAVVSVTGGAPLLVYEHAEDRVGACWVAS